MPRRAVISNNECLCAIAFQTSLCPEEKKGVRFMAEMWLAHVADKIDLYSFAKCMYVFF